MRSNNSFSIAAITVAMLLASGITATAVPTATIAPGKGTGKILILYFAPGENSETDVVSSASVTKRKGRSVGMVRALAEMIQENTGGDLVPIRTSVKYQSNIDRLIDYAADEQKKKARPPLISDHREIADYDVVFIGYPVWWYDLPMVMYSFFERYDLAGKRVIPFCVHNGSRFSSTIETISELEPRANVSADGFAVSIRQINSADTDVARWVTGLKLN